eukprot:420819_1
MTCKSICNWIIIFNILQQIHSFDTTLNINSIPQSQQYDMMKFGANSGWIDLGGGIILNGELIEDRSFRRDINYNSLDSNNHAYTVTIPGDNTLTKYYNGYAIINRTSNQYPINIYKKIIAPIIANTEYTLSFSILTDNLPSNSNIDIVLWNHLISNNLASKTITITNTNGIWTRYTVTLTPTANEYKLFPQLMFSIGTTTPNAIGSFGLDEIRFSMTSATNSFPIIDSNVVDMINQIGIKSLRWPGGIDVDTFQWKESIGTLNKRGEIQAQKGEYQTASYGLDEFMNLCETNDIIPYLQVNIIDSEQSAIDLIEYLIGDQATTYGAMRMDNGHLEAYNIKYFELGNEPNSNYGLNYSYADSGKGYATLAYKIGNVILNKWLSIKGNVNDIYLISATEMQFQLADWISIDLPSVNLVRQWNNDVYNFPSYDVLSVVNGVSGHYYSFFGKQTGDVQSVFEYLMSGSQVMYQEIMDDISISTGDKSNFWISEYGTIINNETNDAILPQHLYDFQAGLNIANILIGILSDYENIYFGAHIHNLAEEIGFGIINRDKTSGDWCLRPTGIVIKLLSIFSNQTVYNCSVSNTDPITITTGDGSVPSGITYNRLKCIATDQLIAILNLNYDQNANVSISINAMNLKDNLIKVSEYYHDNLYANNEVNTNNIGINEYNTSYSQHSNTFGIININIKPHSLVLIHIDYETIVTSYSTTIIETTAIGSTTIISTEASVDAAIITTVTLNLYILVINSLFLINYQL